VLEGGLNSTLHAEGVIDILDFEFYPWGNAYYAQEDCYGYPNYDRNQGYPCWQAKCGVAGAPAECFEGTILCQHGADECSVNLLEGCAKTLYPDVLTYMDFAVCLESNYPDGGEACANELGLSWSDIEACTTDEEAAAKISVADANVTAWADIPGTPTIFINGAQLKTTDALLYQVCNAYTGTKPAGCP